LQPVTWVVVMRGVVEKSAVEKGAVEVKKGVTWV